MTHTAETALNGYEPLETRSELRSRERFALVTAGHHFLFCALPFRHAETELALDAFVAEVNASSLSEPDLDAILLRCLHVCDRHTGGRLPTLVEQYLTNSDQGNSIERFSTCIRRVLRYRGVGDPKIQRAIAIVDERYADPHLSTREVALFVDACPTTFCMQFRREIGITFRSFLRSHRLDRAAALISGTDKSIKEVWAAVGYNHASNFAHDFKRRFGMSPRAYREHVIRSAAAECHTAERITPSYPPVDGGVTGKTILLVDEDECTVEWIGTCLRLAGYAVDTASSGAEGLRLADSTSPDAILLEFRLPDMDGVTFLRRLRARHAATRAALFTADLDVYDRKHELSSLEASIASKLCDLEMVEALVAYMAS